MFEWKNIILILILILFTIFLFVFFLVFYFKNWGAKILQKKLILQRNKITKITNKLSQYNNQFFELSKKDKKYKEFEHKIAIVILEMQEIINIFEDMVNEFNYHYNKQNKIWIKLKEYLVLKYIFKKAKKAKKEIQKLFTKNNKWAQIESSNITNVVNFVLKINGSFKKINEFYEKNLISDFKKYLNKRKLSLEKRIIKIINWFQDDKYLNKAKKEIKRNKKILIKLIKEYTFLVVGGIKYYTFINEQIEDKIKYAKNLFNNNKEKIRFLYSGYWINNFSANIKIKIKEIKNLINKTSSFKIKDKFEKELININSKIEEVIFNLSKEVIAYKLIDKQRKQIINILDEMIENNKKLQNYKINDIYQDEYNLFIKNDLESFSFIRNNNWSNKNNISFAIKLGELNFLLKKMYNLIFLQENLLNKKKNNTEECFQNIKKENINIYNEHNFDYPLTDDIQKYQNEYEKILKDLNKNKQINNKKLQLLKIYNEILKWKIIVLNSEILVSKELLERHQEISEIKELNVDEFFVMNNLFYNNKFKEMIIKFIKLKNKE